MFLRDLIKKYGRHQVWTDGADWYKLARQSLNLKHDIYQHGSCIREVAERTVQRLKDRTESLDDLFPCRSHSETCRFKHIWNWISVFWLHHQREYQIFIGQIKARMACEVNRALQPFVKLKSREALRLLVALKICNFSVNGRQRVGLVTGIQEGNRSTGDVVYDASLAYAALLANRGKNRPYETAKTLLPPEIQSFLDGGQDCVDAMNEVNSFVKEEPTAHGPSGEKMTYGLNEVRLLAPVPKPGMVLCGVLNTAQIFNRLRNWTDNKRPTHPFYFAKARSSIIGPGDPIEIPELLAWPEAELAMIINKKAKNIKAFEVEDYILGYAVFNDVTAGGLHADDTVHYINPDGSEGIPFRFLTRYKGFDTFGPIGPWIVTKDEIKDPNNLGIRCWINGVLAQEGNTNELSTTCQSLMEYISTYHTLSPGDIIVSGTCPPAKGRLLRDNDLRKIGGECTCEIENVGRLTNPIKPIATSKKYADASQVL